MLLWCALVIPFLFAGVQLLFFTKHVTWWEVLIPFGVSGVLVLGARSLALSVATYDTEFWGSYAKECWFYQGWDEYIQQTCTRTYTDADGNTQTETYDCSYVEDHSPYVEFRTNIGQTITVASGGRLGKRFIHPFFSQVASEWGNQHQKDMHRPYYWTDGDAYYSVWPGSEETLRPVSVSNRYENRAANSPSMFPFRDFNKEEKERYGLHDVPKVKGIDQPLILGDGGPSQPLAERRLQIANAVLGSTKQVRIFVLLFHNQPIDTAFKQADHWEGGNKNELVVCIGVDDSYHVSWSHVFSWSRSERLKVDIRDYIGREFQDSRRTLDLVKVVNYTASEAEKQFVRRHFSEFDSLTVEPPFWAQVATIILTVLINVGLAAWTIGNEFRDYDGDDFAEFRRDRRLHFGKRYYR